MALYLNKHESSSPKDALCQVWLKLAQWFWRRRGKGESLQTDIRKDRWRATDDRRSEKLTWSFSSGELKMEMGWNRDEEFNGNLLLWPFRYQSPTRRFKYTLVNTIDHYLLQIKITTTHCILITVIHKKHVDAGVKDCCTRNHNLKIYICTCTLQQAYIHGKILSNHNEFIKRKTRYYLKQFLQQILYFSVFRYPYHMIHDHPLIKCDITKRCLVNLRQLTNRFLPYSKHIYMIFKIKISHHLNLQPLYLHFYFNF